MTKALAAAIEAAQERYDAGDDDDAAIPAAIRAALPAEPPTEMTEAIARAMVIGAGQKWRRRIANIQSIHTRILWKPPTASSACTCWEKKQVSKRKITVTSDRDSTDRSVIDPTLEQGVDHAPQSTAEQNVELVRGDISIEVEWDEENQTFIAVCWPEPGCFCAGYGATIRTAVNNLLDGMRAEP